MYTRALPGIDELTASRPDVIVVDLALRAEREQLTGLQVVHSARCGTALRDVPIIVLVTQPAALDVTWPDLMDRGDIHRLEKPFDLFSFDRVVNTALGMREGGSAIARAAALHAVSAGVSDKTRNNENPRDDMDDARELLNLRAIEVSTCAALSQTSSTAAADDVRQRAQILLEQVRRRTGREAVRRETYAVQARLLRDSGSGTRSETVGG